MNSPKLPPTTPRPQSPPGPQKAISHLSHRDRYEKKAGKRAIFEYDVPGSIAADEAYTDEYVEHLETRLTACEWGLKKVLDGLRLLAIDEKESIEEIDALIKKIYEMTGMEEK